MNRKATWFTAAAAVLTSFCGSNAIAQSAEQTTRATGFGDVVVTARRKQERLQTVPVAVTVLNQEEMSNKGTFTPFTLAQTVPGFHVAATNSGTDALLLTIRGQNQAAQTLFPAVIPYYAETPQLKGFSLGQFYDLENVQVLRGPQGARFGRVTTGGAVLISPKRPSEDFGGFVQAKAGNYSMHELDGALNIPIVKDKVLFRAAFDVNRRDGYTYNITTGIDLDNVHYDSERLSLIVRPFEGLENYTTAQYVNINQTGSAMQPIWLTPGSTATFLPGYADAFAAQQLLGPRVVANGSPAYGPNGGTHFMQQTFVLSNVTTYDLNDNLSFKNVFGYSTFNQHLGLDDDGTALPVIDLKQGSLPTTQQRQFSEEFQVNGKLFDQRLNWTLGGYLDEQKPTRRNGGDVVLFFALNQSGTSYITTRSKAAYGSFEYDLRDFVKGLKINGGMRYTVDKLSADTVTYLVPLALFDQTPVGYCTTFLTFSCQHNNLRSTATTWEAGATYQATNDLFLYASGRRGYRGGGVNVATLNPQNKLYRPEFDTEVEIGFKADWSIAGMKARTNVALFRDSLKNIQKSVTFVAAGISQSYTTNAAAATIQGVEFEGKLEPVDGLTLGLNYAFTDAQFEKDPSLQAIQFNPVNGICNWLAPAPPNAGEPGFCPYNAFQAQPKHQASFSAEYELPLSDSIGTIRVGGEYNYQSKQSYNDVNFGVPLDYGKAYGILNWHVSWENIYQRPVDLTFFMTNATDTLYRQQAVQLGYLSNVGYNIVGYGEPRMFGASLKYRFGTE